MEMGQQTKGGINVIGSELRDGNAHEDENQPQTLKHVSSADIDKTTN